MNMKPSIPKGTRDFGPEQVYRRNYIFGVIRAVFVRNGYRPIETPTMELLSTLTGKYGEEGDRLLFKVLNNGHFLEKANEEALAERDSRRLIPSIAEKGLRYDLTVPFARYVVMHQHEINYPFKRYQIQPVWRGDRPQRGRYQEFYQCDADVVGSNSLMYEAELVHIYDEVFHQLGIPVEIHLNNRKLLYGIAEAAGIADRFMDMTVSIDKLDKVGMDGVRKEMLERGIPAASIEQVAAMLVLQKPEELRPFFAASAEGLRGLEEMAEVYAYLEGLGMHNDLIFNVTLARGLTYYTGCILEVKAKGVAMGSIGGGGRYDDLTGVFGLTGVSGVGISFGADRIYDVMETLNLFPADEAGSLRLLLIAFDQETHLHAFRLLQQFRKAGLNAELYPEPAKLKKQLKYANDRGVPFVALIGSEEMASGTLSLKQMASGEQETLTPEALLDKLL
jgi:histidyl-tRNA synthetase